MKIIQPPSYKAMDTTPPPHRLLEMNQVPLLSLLLHKLLFCLLWMVTPLSFQAALVVGSPCRSPWEGSSLPLPLKVFLVPSAITFDLVDAFKAEPTLPSEAQEATPVSGRTGPWEKTDGMEPGELWRRVPEWSHWPHHSFIHSTNIC